MKYIVNRLTSGVTDLFGSNKIDIVHRHQSQTLSRQPHTHTHTKYLVPESRTYFLPV